MSNTFSFDLDKINSTEHVANALGAVAYATMKLKDLDVPNEDILPILNSLMGVDIEPRPEHEKMITSILTMVEAYAKVQDKNIKDTMIDICRMKPN